MIKSALKMAVCVMDIAAFKAAVAYHQTPLPFKAQLDSLLNVRANQIERRVWAEQQALDPGRYPSKAPTVLASRPMGSSEQDLDIKLLTEIRDSLGLTNERLALIEAIHTGAAGRAATETSFTHTQMVALLQEVRAIRAAQPAAPIEASPAQETWIAALQGSEDALETLGKAYPDLMIVRNNAGTLLVVKR
jgi:hypothetical protein